MWKPIEMLLGRLHHASQTGEVLNMKYFYAGVTLDIINAYCFAREPVVVTLPDFGRNLVDNVDGFLLISLLNIHIPWVLRIAFSLPVRIQILMLSLSAPSRSQDSILDEK